MALFDKKFASGFAIGLGAGLFGPRLLPTMAEAARPMLKASVKAGLLALEFGREATAHIKEAIEDGVAEARSELAHGTDHVASAKDGSNDEPRQDVPSAAQAATASIPEPPPTEIVS